MERKHLIALALVALTMTGVAIYGRLNHEPKPAEVAPPSAAAPIAFEMRISGARTFTRLGEIIEAADLMGSAPESPGGLFALLTSPPGGLASRVPSDASIVGLARLEDGSPGWAFATQVRPDGLELTGQGPGDTQWVAHPPRSGRPSAAVKGEVAFGGQRERVAAFVEQLEAKLASEGAGSADRAGLHIEITPTPVRNYANLASALITRAASVFREGIDELEAARGRPPERGDPRALIAALSSFTTELLGAIAQSSGARLVLDEADALSLEVDLPSEVMREHFSPEQAYVPMPVPERTIIAFGGPSPSVETFERFIGSRMDEASLQALSQSLETSSRQSAGFAMGLESRRPWFELVGRGAPTDKPAALDEPFAKELLGALVGCQPSTEPEGEAEATDEDGPEPTEAPACEEGLTSWSRSTEGERAEIATHRLSLGTGDLQVEQLELQAREGETLIAGGLIRLGQLNRVIALFSGEVWELLRTRTQDPLRVVVARKDSGVVLRLHGTSAAFGPLAAMLAELVA